MELEEDKKLWPVTRAMLRLGDKYQAEDVVSRGKQRLLARLPEQIEDWDAIYHASARRAPVSEDHVVAMANVARLLKLPGIHTRALYRCAQLKTKTLLDGCPGADGTQEYLSKEDLASCLDARQTLFKYHVDIAMNNAFDDVHQPDCYKGCNFQHFRNTLYENVPTSCDPLSSGDWAKEHCEANGGCRSCQEFYDTLYQVERRWILSRLALLIRAKPLW